MIPMLAKAVDLRDAVQTMLDPAYWVQPKIDGHRRIAATDGQGGVTGTNRLGDVAVIPPAVAADLRALRSPAVFDAELLGDRLVVFDLLLLNNTPTLGLPLDERLAMLEDFMRGWQPDHVVLCPTARTLDEKDRMIRQVRDGRGEGFVAKRSDSLYQPGQRDRDWTKAKLIKSIDCVVEWIGTEKANFGITLYGPDGTLIEGGRASDGTRRGGVAECTRQAGDGRHVQVGDVVEIQCLYASDPSDDSPHGRLVQPTRPRIRHDKLAAECTTDQLDTIRTNKDLVLEMSTH